MSSKRSNRKKEDEEDHIVNEATGVVPNFAVTQRIEPFHGFKEDVDEWLEDFERIAAYNGWEDSRKKLFLCLSLKGAAKNWLKLMEPGLPYNGLVKELKAAFTPIGMTETYERRLLERRCVKDETVGEYYYSILDLCRKVDVRMMENSIKMHFIRGLPKAIKEHVICSSAENLAAAYKEAQMKEYSLNFMKEESESLLAGKCYYCGLPGHKEKNCFKKKKYSDGGTI